MGIRPAVAWIAVLAALLGAILIQLATNLHNDFVDSERGDVGPATDGPGSCRGLRPADAA
ncbi:MAG: hypothetical protein WDN48_14495 [Pseudolabrys sp.]